ncbi:hypothetical protein CAOG_005647 [Capsaspora owczarzaki ATCC 30864]|uniref:Uncharacterized protein n=2 Tax=Capsaspora owczarzaki (strain ATCC 30864) TaxID=595528 RepID=A0A0D2VUV8_CAPO3|nr:hypothetical protein CAOG_005647 [Capsaspora owczarzaki ATCC 30864]
MKLHATQLEKPKRMGAWFSVLAPLLFFLFHGLQWLLVFVMAFAEHAMPLWCTAGLAIDTNEAHSSPRTVTEVQTYRNGVHVGTDRYDPADVSDACAALFKLIFFSLVLVLAVLYAVFGALVYLLSAFTWPLALLLFSDSSETATEPAKDTSAESASVDGAVVVAVA